MPIRDVTDAILMDMLRRSDRMVVAEFWSPGCSVCKEVAPHFEEAARDLADEVDCVRVNTDANGHMASKLGVTGTPTFVFLCRSDTLGEIVGFANATALRNTVRDVLRHKAHCRTKHINYEMDGYG
jgi:thioredoxin-like negative regulator of GroEL